MMIRESAGHLVNHPSAARYEVRTNDGARHKLIEEVDRVRVKLLARSRIWNFKAANAAVDLGAPVRREVSTDRDVVAGVVFRNAILVQETVLRQRTDVPSAGAVCHR